MIQYSCLHILPRDLFLLLAHSEVLEDIMAFISHAMQTPKLEELHILQEIR